MTRQEFNEICIENGFVKKKRFYFRKYGDNILQAIFVGKNSRRDEDISFGAWSLYGELFPEWFSLSGDFCQFNTDDLMEEQPQNNAVYYIGKLPVECYKPYTVTLESKFDIMAEKGIPIFNQMSTQASFIETFERLEISQRRPLPIGYIELCGPYLYLHDRRRALERLNIVLGHDMTGMYMEYQPRCSNTDDVLELIDKYMLPRKPLVDLWTLIVCKGEDEVRCYIEENLKRNTDLLAKIGL